MNGACGGQLVAESTGFPSVGTLHPPHEQFSIVFAPFNPDFVGPTVLTQPQQHIIKMSQIDGAHATVGEWIAWATGVGSPKTTEHQRDVPAARRPSGEDKLKGAAVGWGAGAAAFIVAVRAAGHALAVVRIAAHHHIAPVAGALCVAASGVSAALARVPILEIGHVLVELVAVWSARNLLTLYP